MNYISRITIDKAYAIRKNLVGLYEWHKAVWHLFPDQADKDRDFLIRLDYREPAYRLIILSENKPQKPDWCPADAWESREVPEDFYKKDRYFFQLLANPTKTLSKRDPKGNKKKNGSHYALTKKEELYDWIFKKSAQSGFKILEEPELEITPPVFHKLYKKNSQGTIVGVEFKGGLKVIDNSEFINAVKKGIGRARGFGFGMLVLKPIL